MAAMAAATLPLWVTSTRRPSSSLVSCVSTSSASPKSVNYASSSFFESPQSKKLKFQCRHGGRGLFQARAVESSTPVATIAPPPWPPVNPDTSKEAGEPSVGMEEALKQDGGEEISQEQEEVKSSDGVFVWKDHWYPVSLIEDLDPSVPTAFQLLGRELVLWKDNQGEWRVFLDKCPHRLAPLSVRAANLFGWRRVLRVEIADMT